MGYDQKKLGGIIRSKRAYLEMSQGRLAMASGVCVDTISDIEHGRCSPTMQTVHKVCKALSIPLGALDDCAKDSAE